ncbi:MAG TPA: YciI family protein [Opitutus sp.]|nr:YciI family protein [Opitutus sp.]
MPPESAAPASSYMLLFRNGGPEAHAHLTPAERAALAAKWNTWVDSLKSRGAMEQGRPLGLEGRVVTGLHGERVTDGPYAETKEIVAGYIMIRATHLDAAAEIAKGCPGLAIGLIVEVRPLQDFSPVLEEVKAVAPGSR